MVLAVVSLRSRVGLISWSQDRVRWCWHLLKSGIVRRASMGTPLVMSFLNSLSTLATTLPAAYTFFATPSSALQTVALGPNLTPFFFIFALDTS